MTQEKARVDIKTAEAAKEADVEGLVSSEALIKQVEYFFGDNIHPTDRFIKEACSKNEGWMPIESLFIFNRVKAFVRKIAKDARVAKIAEIMKASELVEVDEAGTKIRRNPNVPISDTSTDDTHTRTVYLKGFDRTTDVHQLWDFFSNYEGLRDVTMSRYEEATVETDTESEEGENDADKQELNYCLLDREKKFQGSVLLKFNTPEQAQKLLEEKDLVFRGTPISEKMLHSSYKKKKEDEQKERMARREKKRSDKIGVVEKKEVTQEDSRGSTRPEDHMVKGALLKVKNIPCGFSREQFKEKWYEATNIDEFKIVFADFNKVDTEGVLGLEKEGSAAEALKLLPEGKLPMGEDKIIEFIGFTDADETEYWEKIKTDRTGGKRTFGGRGGRGGRGGYKRRKY